MKYFLTAAAFLFCTSAYAKVDLENAFLLSSGMNKKEVLEIMGGKPMASEFTGELEEWHFCYQRSPARPREYVSIFFVKGSVVAMKQYGIRKDLQKAGTCMSGIKGGSYREPDIVKEYRLKAR